MHIEQLLPIPMIVAFIELLKMLGMDKKYAKAIVFVLSVFFGVAFILYPDFSTNLVQIIVYSLGAIGFYEAAVKPTKEIIDKKNVAG